MTTIERNFLVVVVQETILSWYRSMCSFPYFFFFHEMVELLCDFERSDNFIGDGGLPYSIVKGCRKVQESREFLPFCNDRIIFG
jgi:hypothetical protein